MGLSGRPRGRPSKRSQLQQSHARPLRVQPHRHAGHAGQRPAILALARGLGAIKEDVGASLHDKVDVVSFRSDALQRYALNHEQIENVTTKLVHTSKIIPPRLFAMDGLENAAAMQKQLLEYEKQVVELQEPAKDVLNADISLYLRECDLLAKIQATVLLGDAVKSLGPALKNTLEQLHLIKKRPYVSCKRKPYSITVDNKVDEAPANYDPRSVQTQLPQANPQFPFADEYPENIPGNEPINIYKAEERPPEMPPMYEAEGRGGAEDAISSMIFDGAHDADAMVQQDFDEMLFSGVNHI